MNNASVYTEALTIIVPIVTLALAVNGWMYKLVADERKARGEAVKDLHEELEEARKSRHDLRNDYMAFRERMARDTVTQDTLQRFENRIILSVDKLGERLDRVLVSNTTIVKT